VNLVILGPQGSGKGTQSEMVAQKYEAEHFDTGKLLRQISKTDTPLGKEIHEIVIEKKELVPSKILREILHLRLNDLQREQSIVFDGVPRNTEQARYFEEALQEFGRKLDKVFFINISEEESIKRISKRWICKKCRKILIMGKDIKNHSEVCPKCGNEIAQRADDTPEGVKKRLGIYQKETIPVLDFFKKEGLLVEINGEQSIKKVFEDIIKILETSQKDS
jgi:adenylate kinase